MGNLALLVAHALASGGVLQYPDKQLYKSAMLLTPDERPASPVRMRDSKVDDWTGHSPGASAFWNKNTKEIVVNKRADEYKNAKLLAAVMAHEAVHEKQNGQPSEGPAYQRQYDVLKRLKYSDRDELERMSRQAKIWMDDDTKRR